MAEPLNRTSIDTHASTVDAKFDGDCPQTPALESIYDAYAPFVWRSLRRLGVSELDAADAVQDVFLVVHRRLHDFEQRSTLKTWLFGIAMRVASEYVRRHPRRREDAMENLDLATTELSPAERAERSEAVELLYRLLQELPSDQRAVFILAELEQQTIVEIAEAVGTNFHTATSRLKAARHRFEQALLRHRRRDRWRLP